MSKLEKLIEEFCPNGVKYKKLGDIATISRGGNFQKKDFCDNGFPCIHYGQIYTRYGLFANETIAFINQDVAKKSKKAVSNDIIMAVTSENIEDVCKCVAWLGDGEIAVSGHTAIIHHDLNTKYLVYYFYSSMFYKQKIKFAHGTKVIEVTPNKLGDINIPVPPLEVQSEIVRILDNFTELKAELTAGLKAELTARKKQYEYYCKKAFEFSNSSNINIVKLSEIADIGTGSSNTNEQLEIGDYPFFVRSQEVRRKNEYEYDETAIITSGDGVGVGKIFHFVEGKYALHQRAYRIHIKDPQVMAKYFFYYMKNTFYEYIQKNAVSSSVTSVRRPMMDNYTVPIPTIQEQQRIVVILERFETLYNDIFTDLSAEIEARTKQYEYYRDKLLTFKELS